MKHRNGKKTGGKAYEAVKTAAGEEALGILKLLEGKEEVSEFSLAKKAKQEIQKVRNLLYRLQGLNLVAYKRVKDNKSGWYVSYWTYNKKRVKELIKKLNAERLQRFREQLSEEAGNASFFMCPNNCARLDFNNAMQHLFRCPECGNVLEQQDNSRTISGLKTRIRQLQVVA